MKYKMLLTLFVLVQGQENRSFQLVLNEMGPGRTSRAYGISTALPKGIFSCIFVVC